MSLHRYFLHDFFTAREFDEVDGRLRDLRRQGRRRASRTARQMEELEADLSFLALMNRALLELLIEQNLASKEDLLARMAELDMLDGEADGGLSVEEVARDLGVEAPAPKKPEAPQVERKRRRRR